jgi:hypothetical protein
LNSDERKHSSTSAITRPNSTYSNDASTSPSPQRRSQRHHDLEHPKHPCQQARSSLCTPQGLAVVDGHGRARHYNRRNTSPGRRSKLKQSNGMALP